MLCASGMRSPSKADGAPAALGWDPAQTLTTRVPALAGMQDESTMSSPEEAFSLAENGGRIIVVDSTSSEGRT